MKTLKISILIICTVCAYDLSCPKYSCNETPVKESQECAFQRVDNLTLSLCEKELVCEKIELENPSVCIKMTTPNGSLLPGELCTDNKQCKSDYCTKGDISVCKGHEEGHSCNSSSECDVGFFCDKGLCKRTSISCNEAGIGCSANEFCDRANQKCIKFGSLNIGDNASAPAACRTYYQDANGKCSKGPKLKDLKNIACPEKGNCIYSVESQDISTPCICKKDDTGKKYCPPSIGNIDTDAVNLSLND